MKNRNILKNKYYLYLTEFFAGMGMMAVELGASRLMAPYFSSSQIVWTIIISTIMIAMALGNLYGGRSADKDPDPDRLYKRLLIAAVWIAAIPVLGRYIILGITGVLIVTISQNLLTAAGFIACIVIFVFPCFLLGTVTPSLTKYALLETEADSADGLTVSGSIVGRLGAANTIGSNIVTDQINGKAKHILTDDCAPVEMLSMRAIDEIIAEELEYYKKIFREKGLSGLMQAL